MSLFLQTGEHTIGRYKVRFARFSQGGWHTQGPWMRLIVTTRRLIMLPDDARQEDSVVMVIPVGDIVQIWSLGLGRRDGGVIELDSGELLYFYVDWSQSARLMRDIRTILRPVARTTVAHSAAAHKRYVN